MITRLSLPKRITSWRPSGLNARSGSFSRTRLHVPVHLGRAASAVLLSSLLYVFAVGQSSAEASWLTPFSVPVDVVNVPPDLVAVEQLAPIRLRVLATQQVFSRLQPQSFTAQLDASQAHAGDTELPVSVRSTDPGERDVSADPSLVNLRLEAVHQRVLPVQVHLTGKVPAGYQPGDPHVNPDHVTVRGPASEVDQAVQDVVDVNVQGATISVDGAYTSRIIDANGNTLATRNLGTTPSSVSVEVPITQLTQYKQVGIQPVTHGEPAPGYVVQPLEINSPTATLVGSAAGLASASFVQTQPIDITGITSTVVRQVAIVPPSGTLLLQPGQMVTVTVRVMPLVTTHTLQLQPSVINVSAGLTLTHPPAAVAVTITGPAPTLSTLAAADLRVVLDAANKGRGQYQLTPQAQNLPPGMTLDRVDPQQVEVDLTAAPAATG